MLGRIEVHDKALLELIPVNATPVRIAGGFGFTEGPVWCREHLLFSDIRRNRTVRWRELPEGPEVTTYRTDTAKGNGLTLDLSGRLLTCEGGARRVSVMDANGDSHTLIDKYNGKRLNGPNDIIVGSNGDIYFTDPAWALPNRTEGKELTFNGVFKFTPEGSLTVVADDFDRPNGLALSPDEATLYIDDSGRQHIRAFDVRPDGTLANGRLFLDMQSDAPGPPDGMKVDREGNIYCTGAGGISIIDPSGRLLGRIIPPEAPANLAWGGEGWSTLFITARTSVYRLHTLATGIPVPISP